MSCYLSNAMCSLVHKVQSFNGLEIVPCINKPCNNYTHTLIYFLQWLSKIISSYLFNTIHFFTILYTSDTIVSKLRQFIILLIPCNKRRFSTQYPVFE